MITNINSEDRLVQQTFAEHLEQVLGWESVYAFNTETFGPHGTLGRASEREAVLTRDLRAALQRLNPEMPESARELALERLTRLDSFRSLVQHNRDYYDHIRNGVPVEWRDPDGRIRRERARVIDFRVAANNRFLAVRELKLQGVRVPHYNRRADLILFVNGLPLVFIELKAVYKNIRTGFDHNLTDYLSEHSIAQAFHAVESVRRQEALKREFPVGARLIEYRVPMPELLKIADWEGDLGTAPSVSGYAALTRPTTADPATDEDLLPLQKRAHPDLGQLGVFWHT